jgi:hypothetical protein
MKAAAIALLCLSLQGCIGWAQNYVHEHPDGMSGVIYTGRGWGSCGCGSRY